MSNDNAAVPPGEAVCMGDNPINTGLRRRQGECAIWSGELRNIGNRRWSFGEGK